MKYIIRIYEHERTFQAIGPYEGRTPLHEELGQIGRNGVDNILDIADKNAVKLAENNSYLGDFDKKVLSTALTQKVEFVRNIRNHIKFNRYYNDRARENRTN